MTAREQDVLRRAGEVSVLILVSLADGPKHGYALIQDVKEFAASTSAPARSTARSTGSSGSGSSSPCPPTNDGIPTASPHRARTRSRRTSIPWNASARPDGCACSWAAPDEHPRSPETAG
jgi:hypothetical protein